jgi:hypothetical protein
MHLAPHVDSERAHLRPEVGGGLLGGGEQPPRMREEPATGGGQLHQVVLPHEQGSPHHLLQALDPLGQALLAKEQPRGRTPEVQLLGSGDKRSDLGEIEIHPVILTDNQRLSRSNRPLFDPGPAACFRGPDRPS